LRELLLQEVIEPFPFINGGRRQMHVFFSLSYIIRM
jgi:hypothetical protein